MYRLDIERIDSARRLLRGQRRDLERLAERILREGRTASAETWAELVQGSALAMTALEAIEAYLEQAACPGPGHAGRPGPRAAPRYGDDRPVASVHHLSVLALPPRAAGSAGPAQRSNRSSRA